MRARGPACARPTLPPCCALLHIAALWAWNVYSRVQQRREDQDTLQAMAARPLAITEHAACRMDCRCEAAVLHASCRRPAGLLCGRDWCRLPGSLTAGRRRIAWILPSLHLLLVILATPRAPLSGYVCPRCSFIKRGEIEETLRSGRINARKSQPQLKPCEA